MRRQVQYGTALTGLLAVVVSAPLSAQDASTAQATAPVGLQEIVVTARKTEERLIDAPLSITAFSAADIEEKGFKTLEDVARSAPGVQYSNQGGQTPGRFASAIRFRGMNVNSDSPSLQLGALFVDGVYALGGTQSIPYDDVERIEVIKGPQAALYGRGTFGGAINYITRTPSLTEYSGSINALGANYGEQDISANFEGPLLSDTVAFRIGGRYYSRGAIFRASDGGGLGEESSKSAQLTLYAKPADSVSLRFRAFYNEDEDGPAAGGLIPGIRNDSCTGQQIATQDPLVPIASPMNYICGLVPAQGDAISATFDRQIINTVTSLRPPQAIANGTPNFILDNVVNSPAPTVNGRPIVLDVPAIDRMGLVRNVVRLSFEADFDLPADYTLSFQTGYNELGANWVRSFGLSALGRWFSRDPQDSTDKSYELRLTSPTDGRFSWLVGANYYEQQFIQSGSGGDTAWLCANFGLGTPGAPCSGVSVIFRNTLLQNSDEVETTGLFASLNYDITETFTGSLEGRYQRDISRSGVLLANPTEIEQKEFLPRAILRWQPTDETNVYASFSKGILPGIVNAQISSATPRELAQYEVQAPGQAFATVSGDELDMYELGWKQQWLDRRAATNIAAYYGEWAFQKGRSVALIQEDCGSPSHPVSAGGCPNGANGLPAINADGSPFRNSRNFNIPGTSKLWGLEFEGALLITERWDSKLTLTYAKSEYDDFQFNFVAPIAGFSQQKGNSNARFPEWSGSLASGYSAPFKESGWDWFVNGDISYFGKTNVDESNLAQCDAYTLANARLGAEKDGVRIEGFVRNVFDDDSWTACARWTDFDFAPGLGSLTRFQGVAVSPQVPRQYGIRASIKF